MRRAGGSLSALGSNLGAVWVKTIQGHSHGLLEAGLFGEEVLKITVDYVFGGGFCSQPFQGVTSNGPRFLKPLVLEYLRIHVILASFATGMCFSGSDTP